MKSPISPWLDEQAAPNGLPVRDNFLAWFGNSRARDMNGDPLVLYHGTSATFDAFSTASHRSVLNNDYQGDGFHFTPSARVA
jgi:lysophospholipase L1-like esterase